MKRWYLSLPEEVRWWATFAAFIPVILAVGIVTDDSWLGWLLTMAAGFCCGWLAGVVADHFTERGEEA